MKHYFFIFLLILSTNILANSFPGLPGHDHNNTTNKIHADRWLEIDLYWFDHSNMEKSAMEFWDRYYPLMNGIDGWKGVILNVGWISDYILKWQGNLNQEIKFPKNMKAWGWIKDEGQLAGSTLERIQLWKDRFEKLGKPKVINYDAWTYTDLKKMVFILKNVARDKYNLKDIKVDTSVLGFQSVYGDEKSEFSKEHPNSFMNNAPNLEAKLSADPQKFGAYPNGIPEGIPLTEFFGKQWGNLSKALNLDVILLRDSYLGVGVYERLGPYGKTASADTQKVAQWSRATTDLVKQVKISNPEALVIGYSNAASAVADWRVNCFDLEAIAKEGYLDGWIDQTWAGAWNEVGQRPDDFWNNQLRGWTYQLSNVLIHAAVLPPDGADIPSVPEQLSPLCPIALRENTIELARNKLKKTFKNFDHYLAEKTENKINLKLILLFIPAAYVSNLFHEFGHWITGEILGNNMAYSLNYVWPKNGHYIDASHDLYVSIGGPAFTILLSFIFLLVIERYKTIYAYPFVFFSMFSRFFSILLGGFSKQDESRISVILENGAYTVAIIVLMILLLFMLRGSYKLKIGLKNNCYFLAMSTICQLLVIKTYEVIL